MSNTKLYHNQSSIIKYFAGKRLFITGGTGFLGKVLIEKLLRVCYDLDKIYILVRPKKGMSIEDRFHELLNFACFDRLKKERKDFMEKLCLINGDCTLPNLGISDEDRNKLKNEIHIFINAAANIKFNYDLYTAANNNVRSVRAAISLAKSMPNLEAFVQVSTAYSYCPRSEIKEEFYDEPISEKCLMNIVDGLDKEILKKISPSILGEWPNVYIYTKATSESLIRNELGNLPCVMIRPGCVHSSIKEPTPGWTDNLNGAMGIPLLFNLGILRCIRGKEENIANLVPVDYVVNNILAATWDLATTKPLHIPIYNYTGWNNNLINWGKFGNYTHKSGLYNYPSIHNVWYSNYSITENLLLFKLKLFFLHIIPAYIIDFILIIVKNRSSAVKNLIKYHKMVSSVEFFILRQWHFHTDHVIKLWNKLSDTDKELFNFSMENINWEEWMDNSVLGARIYLLKDPIETLPMAKRKMKYLRLAHYGLLTILTLSFLKLILFLLNLIF